MNKNDASPVIRLGTRGSDLALWQARHVRDLLDQRAGVATDIVIIETIGDKDQSRSLDSLGSQGVFTKELESALLDGRVDLAVHSHKDLPTESPEGLTVAAVPARGPIRECLVVKPEAWQDDAPAFPLREGARVGTGSARRVAQLRALRPDLVIVDLRGNVPTRMAKLAGTHPGDWSYDAILLAEAGIVRLGLDPAPQRTCLLDPEVFVPAPAQGALALQIATTAPAHVTQALAALHDDATATCVRAERGVLAGLAGGCNLPLGCHARLTGDGVELLAVLGQPDGSIARVSVSASTPDDAAQQALAALGRA